MVQWLSKFASLAEDLNLSFTTHAGLCSLLVAVAIGKLRPSSGPPCNLDALCTDTHMHKSYNEFF